MVDEDSPPEPKRRRVEDSSNTRDQSDQTAQTNQTLNFLTGQRQNRWMQGYNAGSGAPKGGSGGNTNDASSRNPGVATPSLADRQKARMKAALTEELEKGQQRQNAPMDKAVGMRPDLSVQTSTPGAGAAMNSPAVPTAGANVVNYESPYTSTSLPENAANPSSSTAETAMAFMDTIFNTSDQRGLPSPAPSDENTNSPSSGIYHMPLAQGEVTVQPRMGRPPKQPILPSNSSPMAAPDHRRHSGHAHAHAQRPGSTTPLTGGAPGERLRAHVPSPQRAPSSAGQGSPPLRSAQRQAPYPAPARPVYSPSPYHPSTLKARLANQERNMPSNHMPVDDGRLSLLQDAVNKQDWFYIALSQIHALSDRPDLRPEALNNLPPFCWKYIDDLLCSNKMVSPNLLKFLSEFPAPIMKMYSDPTISSHYAPFVNEVAAFLLELPQRWTDITEHCRRIQAPPLVEDLFDGLMLRSAVLQTVAFRAITRMIFGHEVLQVISNHLELAHQRDQQRLMTTLRRRKPQEKPVAYLAFQSVRDAGVSWLQLKRQHELRQQQLAPSRRTVYPQFSLQQWCPDAIPIFEGRQALPTAPSLPARANVNLTAQHSRTQSQHQQLHQFDQQMVELARAHAHAVQAQSPTESSNMPPRSVSRPQVQIPMPAQQHPPSARLVFPHETETPRSQPTEPNTMRTALHEAHLRSPVPTPLRTSTAAPPQLYRYVCRYALPPTPIDGEWPINVINFDLLQSDMDQIPEARPSQNPGELPMRLLSETSRTYRLRCCALPAQGFPNENAWVVADTVWPESLFLELNGRMLEMRRPLHHKKYLPVDLTAFLRSGTNELKAIINRISTNTAPYNYALAVEAVGVISHSTLLTNLENEQSISAETTKASIQKSLAGTSTDATDDDDDLAIVSTSMTIKLFDPFSGSRIFSTPVRGKCCPHKDCFDLETFLSQCKRDRPGMPTVVDCWRCPLCRGDVRPSELVKDEWLVGVRAELDRMWQLDTRAIVVEADGSWKVKVEEKTGVRSASLEREERSSSAANGVEKAKSAIEVIELD